MGEPSTITNTISSSNHLLYLQDLHTKERYDIYRRDDYLSLDHQKNLWHDEIQKQQSGGEGRASSMHLRVSTHPITPTKIITADARRSPSSIMNGPMTSEDTSAASAVYQHSPNIPTAPSEICLRWREKIIEWKYQVVDRFDLSREIVSISTFYLDKYLSKHYVDEELFQLAAMASIYLAIKVHSKKKVSISSIASTGNGIITVEQIEAMEYSIMNDCLNWHMNPPTVVNYIENFYPLIATLVIDCCGNANTGVRQQDAYSLHVQQAIEDSLELSRFLAELSVCVYPFIKAKPSSIAFAAIMYSFDHFNVPQDVRTSFGKMCREYISSSLQVNSREVETCGALLKRVYVLAMPQDQQEQQDVFTPRRDQATPIGQQ